tara:strand:- start:447 stop:605 length:159 start_codon:yes stop_codon:yes gene_type:complete
MKIAELRRILDAIPESEELGEVFFFEGDTDERYHVVDTHRLDEDGDLILRSY